MQLSAELFADFAASIQPAPALPPDRERRRAARVQVSATVAIQLPDSAAGAAQTLLAKVRDFSPRGVSVFLPTRVQPGLQFVLKLKRSDGTTVAILCTALHCRELSPQLYRVGAEFTCVLRDLPVKDVASMVQQAGGAADRDAQKRIRESMLD